MKALGNTVLKEMFEVYIDAMPLVQNRTKFFEHVMKGIMLGTSPRFKEEKLFNYIVDDELQTSDDYKKTTLSTLC